MVQHNTRLAADTAEVLDGIHEIITGLAQARGRCEALTVTATAERGSITVVADGSGAVSRIIFADDVEDLGYTRIARSTVRAAQAAGAEVKRRADAITAPLRDKLARLPKPAEMLDGPAQDDIPAPPPALLTPPSERMPQPGDGTAPNGKNSTPLGENTAPFDVHLTPLDSSPTVPSEQMASDDPGTSGEQSNPDPVRATDFSDQAADIIRLQKARTLLMATGTAERRRVAVTVNADGIIIDIQFSSGISDLDHDEIADAIVEASRHAVAEVARRAAALFAPMSYDRSQFPGVEATLAGLENLRDQLR